MEFVRATGQDGEALREIAHHSEAHWGFTVVRLSVSGGFWSRKAVGS